MSEYILYLDESGIANLAQLGDRYFIISTLTVEVNADSELSGYLKHLKRRHGFKESDSLHAFELFEKKESPIHIKDNKQCKKFTESIIEFIENAPFNIHTYVIDKEMLCSIISAPKGYRFKGSKRHAEDKEFAYEVLVRKILFDYAKFLSLKKSLGAIIAESRGNADSLVIRSFNMAQSKEETDNEKRTKIKERVRETIHSICFANKKSVRSGLELADMISYCANLELNGKMKKRDARGLKQMWEKIKNKLPENRVYILTKKEIRGLHADKIHKITERIQSRLKEFRDLVNPTLR
jgi:hypothetical protein